MVPVVFDVGNHDVWSLSAEIARVADAARSGTADRKELMGSTITVTSLGRLGGIVTTPVINRPEVAIIGINKVVQRPVVLNGAVVVRSMMNLSSSFDHRIVDGWVAASFVQRVKALLEQPAVLFM
jgi:2-oxoisovalerate dehydrogenase E2 component (dihydrolipoyl transacylase)